MKINRVFLKRNLTETVLWANPNTSTALSEQTVTLSQSIRNFKYIKAYWKYSTGTSDSTAIGCLMDVTTFTNISTSLVGTTRLTCGIYGASLGGSSLRFVSYSDDTHCLITGTNDGLTNYVIITKICGAK